MKRDSVPRTLIVATLLCIVCSLLVSAASVALRPFQEDNRTWEKKRKILEAAGLPVSGERQQLEQAFQRIESRLVDLATGKYVPATEVDPALYDQASAARDPAASVAIPPAQDLAGISRREKYSFVYLVRDESGELDQLVLPINGKGLWSTMYGFLALDRDLETVRGLTFYAHGETPGLGGEVDNPDWKAQWQGKRLFDESGAIAIEVIKGTVDPSSPDARHQVDGLSGATITGRGVSNLLHYWLGEHGFAPYLRELRANREES